jgi:hypothetical protein
VEACISSCYEPLNIRTRSIILHYENLNTPPSNANVQNGQEIGQGGELLEEVVPAVLPDCLHDEVGKRRALAVFFRQEEV